MNEAFNPYHAFLGLDRQIVSPSYYQLLQLREREGDASKITAAAEKAMVRVRGQRPGQHAPEWSRLLDEIQAAKGCLLNPAQKQAYDAQLAQKTSTQKSAAPAAPTKAAPQQVVAASVARQSPNYAPSPAPQPAVPAEVNAGIAPNPAQSYAPPGYAPMVGTPNPAWNTPYAPSPAMHPMAPMPQGNPAMMPAGQGWPNAMPGYAPAAIPQSPQPYDPMAPVAYQQMPASPYAAPMGAYPAQGMPNAYPMAMPAQQAAAFPTPTETFAAPTLVKGRPIKRRRSKGPLLLAGTVVGSIAVVGGVLVALNWKEGQNNANQPQVAVNTQPDVAPTTPVPAVGVKTPSAQPPTQPAPMVPVENKNGRPMPVVAEQPEEAPAMKGPAEKMASEKMTAEGSKEAMTLPTPNPGPEKPTTPSPEPMPEPPASETSATKPTREELVALTKAVKEAQAALGEFSFDEADELLVQAEMLAKLPEHHDRINRLQNVAKLARQFREAIVRTMGQLDAGEVLKIGSSTEVAIVDASATELTVRRNGENQTYTLENMPLGLAVHLGERSLNPNSPVTRAAKGAYVFIDKRSEAGQRQKAQTWWEEAQLNGMDMRDLMPVLTDKYDFTADAPKESEENEDAE